MNVKSAGHEKQSVALYSILASIVMIAGKATVGIMTRSLALMTDALHSFLDLSASIITYFAVRISDKPADRDHHYGHGKVESLAALAEVILLFITCIFIGHEAIDRLISKALPPQLNIWAFAVVGISIIIDISRVRALRRVAKKYSSQALAADALNFATDIMSSVVVLFGLVMVEVGVGWADSVAAVGVAIFIISATVRMGKQAVDVLLDRAPIETDKALRKLVDEFPEIMSIKNIRLRTDGRTTFGGLHLNVDRMTTFSRATQLRETIQDEIKRRLPQTDIAITFDPVSKESEKIAETIRFVVSTFGLPLHHLIIQQDETGYFASMHVEMPGDMTLEDAHDQSEQIKQKLHESIDRLQQVTIHTQPYETEIAAANIPAELTQRIADEVRRIIESFEGVQDCHNVVLTPYRGGLALSADMRLDGNLPLYKTRDIAKEVEDRLRTEVVELVSVTLHLEPIKK